MRNTHETAEMIINKAGINTKLKGSQYNALLVQIMKELVREYIEGRVYQFRQDLEAQFGE